MGVAGLEVEMVVVGLVVVVMISFVSGSAALWAQVMNFMHGSLGAVLDFIRGTALWAQFDFIHGSREVVPGVFRSAFSW